MAIFGNIFNELKQVPKDDNANNYEELEAPEDAAGDNTSENPDDGEGYDLEEPEDLPEEDEGDDGGYDLEDPEDLPEEDEGEDTGEESPPEEEGDGDYELDGEDYAETTKDISQIFCATSHGLHEIKLNCYVVFNGIKFYPEEISIERKTQTVEFIDLKGVC